MLEDAISFECLIKYTAYAEPQMETWQKTGFYCLNCGEQRVYKRIIEVNYYSHLCGCKNCAHVFHIQGFPKQDKLGYVTQALEQIDIGVY